MIKLDGQVSSEVAGLLSLPDQRGREVTLPDLEQHPAIRSEFYSGACEDREFIVEWLGSRRTEASSRDYIEQRYRDRLAPDEKLDVQVVDSVAAVLTGPRELGIDWELFGETVREAKNGLDEIVPGVELIPLARYWLSTPNTDSADTGGFHSQYGMGYQYIDDYSASVLLAHGICDDVPVRTLELARNYLHDSIHRSTYRTFRVVKPEDREGAAEEWPIYRHQYGLNFREADGISYSPGQSRELPYSINLNLLMDGVAVLAIAEVLKMTTLGRVVANKHPTASSIVDELFDPTQKAQFSPRSSRFAEQVSLKTAEFLNYWGGKTFRDEVLRAMFSGKVTDLAFTFSESADQKLVDDSNFRQFLERRATAHGWGGIAFDRAAPKNTLWNLTFLSPDYHRLLSRFR